MKIVFLIITGCLINLPVFCQPLNNEINLNKKIKLSSKEISIQNVINEIRFNTDIVFSFEPSEIPLETKIHFNKSEVTIEEILREITTLTDISYVIRAKVIILKKVQKDKNLGITKKIKYTISGVLKDSVSGETLPYATVGILGTKLGTMSNSYGFYSITLPEGMYNIVFRYVGYNEKSFRIDLTNDLNLDGELNTKAQQIAEVVVTKDKDDLKNIERRMTPVNIRTVQTIPSLFSEADILRNIQLLPGINNIAEIGGSVLVRGGNSDQNLMMIDEATVYNSSHLVGQFSVFNPEIVKDIKFYKSGIPLSYGGRISSVMDVTQKDGNLKNFHGSARIGLIATNLELEGPVIKDKASFIVGFRRSYVDMFFKYIPNENVKNIHTYFYDFNSKLNFIINPKNRLYLSCYLGNDLNDLENQDQKYGNITTTLRYTHIFSNKWFSNSSVIFSRYNMAVDDPSGDWGWKNKMGLEHYEFKSSVNYFAANHTFELGIRSIYYRFFPGDQQPANDSSLTLYIKLPTEYAFEPAFYISDNFKISKKLELNYGLRYSFYYFLGPADINQYDPDLPRDPSSITGIKHYKKNEIIKSFHFPEPRISLKFEVTTNHILKLSFNKMMQYIQQVSNTIFPMPYNTWKSSNSYIRPLKGTQYAIGYFTGIKKPEIDFSFEAYYKQLENVIEVQPGKDIWLNTSIDADLLQGKGRSYGIEIMANKSEGRLTGIVSYSWSRSERKIDSPYISEKVNNGNYYVSDYDIPHKFTFSGEYRVSKSFSFTSGFIYQTGRPVSFPDGQYIFMGSYIPYYSGKNFDRMPDFHRLDFGAILNVKKKAYRKYLETWTFSLYNVYARKNPYSIFIRRKSNTKNTEAVKYWAMGIVPSISYCIKF